MPPFTTCFIIIRFNAIKKGKLEAKGNGFIHELSHMVDEMREMQDGNALCMSFFKQRKGSKTKILTKKIENVSFPKLCPKKDNVVAFCRRTAIRRINV